MPLVLQSGVSGVWNPDDDGQGEPKVIGKDVTVGGKSWKSSKKIARTIAEPGAA